MLTLNYQIEVASTPEIIWKVLTELELYSQWATAFSPQSQFEGEWLEGNHIAFFDPELGGTRALVDRIEKHKVIEYHHIAIFNPEHIQDIDSDAAQKWIGSKESYQITPLEHSVLLKVTIETHPDFVSMFNVGWGKALPMIKVICEQQNP
ncbi:SRPBCC family protein [Vibrio neptunius]|uniref:SRPBCC domain-containing protein n=1 Tax=Vibrio neptunius TaxID=170651 RepID=A0ABS3A6C5_9VIBR|nr:SRPBCC domain-containing protein [Vibrio neptunius]MBN3494710.1 SRPBCC domain-containing protein [Vibrio neptunius]MBN3517144.1 SRPBCC domain-containing protein [Vibrio neptunius]MBN3551248.1 SRPBCC domain-containing protein [Vibrio neptunius]MBN3579540.1 SRPBCC domain-containing protein [Vibrio neptunius]MCH9873205.1 SRPBCC domain-containing protein [Vibrio neptunius]